MLTDTSNTPNHKIVRFLSEKGVQREQTDRKRRASAIVRLNMLKVDEQIITHIEKKNI